MISGHILHGAWVSYVSIILELEIVCVIALIYFVSCYTQNLE